MMNTVIDIIIHSVLYSTGQTFRPQVWIVAHDEMRRVLSRCAIERGHVCVTLPCEGAYRYLAIPKLPVEAEESIALNH